MKQLTKRLISFFICACFLVGFIACGDKGAPAETAASAETTAAQEEAETTAPKPNLPDTDWEGREFHVLGHSDPTYPQFDNFEIYAEGETGEIVNDTIYRRNRTIEERYNVKIKATLDYNEAGIIRKTTMAGEQLYDLFFSPLMFIGGVITNGDLLDLNEIEYIDFSQPWWNSRANGELELWGRLYATTSDYGLEDKKRSYTTIMNRDMAKDYDLPDVVALVDDGVWTVDRMTEMCAAVAADLDGDGEMTDADRWGLTMDSYNAFTNYLRGCDVAIITKGEDGNPALTFNNPRTVAAIDKVIALTCDTDFAGFCEDFEGKVDYNMWSFAGKVFKAGEALFIAVFPQSLSGFSADCEFEYGVIPNPKLDESQPLYCSYPDFIGSTLFGVPKAAPAPDFSGFMLEALSAESKYTTLPAYIEISCKNKYTYDEASGRMLDLIFSSMSYDLGIIFNLGGMSEIVRTTIPKKKENVFASEYAKKEKKTLTAIEKLRETVEEIEAN